MLCHTTHQQQSPQRKPLYWLSLLLHPKVSSQPPNPFLGAKMANTSSGQPDRSLESQLLDFTDSEQSTSSAPSPVLCASIVHQKPLPSKRRILKEQGKRILQEASKVRSESAIPDISQVLQDLNLEHSQDVDATATVRAITDPTSVATVDPSISEDAPEVSKSSPKPKKKKVSVAKTLNLPGKSSRPLFDTSSTRASSLSPAPSLSSISMSTVRPGSLLIASLGNPPPYHSTRHSAGHIILQHLRSRTSLPLFTQKSRPYGGGHVSLGYDIGRPELTLYQSAVLMNVSGPPLLKAWKHFVELQEGSGRTPALVVLHDEMETNPGRIKVRRGNSSAKGHNGIKSVQASLQGAGLLDSLGERFVKVGIGIGRPVGGSRQSNDVSAYVLGQLTAKEKEGLEQAAEELESVLYQELARIGQT